MLTSAEHEIFGPDSDSGKSTVPLVDQELIGPMSYLAGLNHTVTQILCCFVVIHDTFNKICRKRNFIIFLVLAIS